MSCTSPGYSSPDGASCISQCQSDGTWSSIDNFQCSPVGCGQPPHVANSSHVSHTATTFGENVTVTCLPGFSPLEGMTLTCDETGNWIGGDRTCDPIDCGDPPTVDDAVASYFDHTTLNSTVRYNNFMFVINSFQQFCHDFNEPDNNLLMSNITNMRTFGKHFFLLIINSFRARRGSTSVSGYNNRAW